MMRKITILLISILLPACSHGASVLNADSLYDSLDTTIANADGIFKAKDERISLLRHQLQKAGNDLQRYWLAHSLYAEYEAYQNDSALVYMRQCARLADQLGRADLRSVSYMRLAHQYAVTGSYAEATKYFGRVSTSGFSQAERVEYLRDMSDYYGEMAAYSQDDEQRELNYARADAYRDTILALVDSSSVEWLSTKISMLYARHQYGEAMRYSDEWMGKVEPKTPAYAYMAYIRSQLYKRQENAELEKYWLAQSAVSDLSCAITNQASLWSLARRLSNEGDLERAYRYIEFAWKCASMFNAHLRNWQISPVLQSINENYKQQLRDANRNLWLLIAAISLLTIFLLLLYVYVSRQRTQLKAARNELSGANSELAEVNGRLSDKNNELSEANQRMQEANQRLADAIAQLNDSNRVKDEYIGKFLSICSDYIDKLDGYRIRVNRKLKANQYQDLMRMTSSEQLKEEELKLLFDNFDTIFLHLFPTFVDDFNALLRPEDKVLPQETGRLNTILRIFALIRLGVDESSKIAEFLRYSPNSIYAYRARIKNKAAGNREEFEQRVREIGMGRQAD